MTSSNDEARSFPELYDAYGIAVGNFRKLLDELETCPKVDQHQLATARAALDEAFNKLHFAFHRRPSSGPVQ